MIRKEDQTALAALFAVDSCPLINIIELQEGIFENKTSHERKLLLKNMKEPLDLITKSSENYLKKKKEVQNRKITINQNFFFQSISTKALGKINYKVVKKAKKTINQVLSREKPDSSICIQAGVLSTLASYSQRNFDTIFMLQKKNLHTQAEKQEMETLAQNMLQIKKDVKTYQKMIHHR